MSRKDTDSGQKSAVSLKDVARVANVSFQTVSRALRQSGYVGPETRARIEAAVEHLGYRPNVNARALVQRTSDVVAIVLPSNVSLVVRNPYIGEVFAGITGSRLLELRQLRAEGGRQFQQIETEPIGDRGELFDRLIERKRFGLTRL